MDGNNININKPVIVEGESEFKAKPEDFMTLLMKGSSNPVNDLKKILKQNTNQNIATSSSNEKVSVDALLEQEKRAGAADIKKLLEKVHGSSTKAVQNLNEKKVDDKELNLALNTKFENNYLQVADWAIRFDESSNHKMYDVINHHTKKILFKSLYLYESAKIIIDLLNNGKYANSPEVTKVLYHEEIFRRSYDDALIFKKKFNLAEARNDYIKSDIYNARYQKALGTAKEAKRNIRNLNEDR